MFLTFEEIKKKIAIFCVIVITYGFIIVALKKENHFYGLNETSDLLDCIFYAATTFSGSTYVNIYPQTQLGRLLILILTIMKFVIIVYPLEKLEGNSFYLNNSKFTSDEIYTIINKMDSDYLE